MRINKVTSAIVTIIIIFKISALILLWEVYKSHNEAVDAQNNRISSIETVNKFKNDFIQLNEFVKSYISTADPKYLIYYYDLLSINDGKKPEPIYYKNPAYWSSVLVGDIEHKIDENKSKESILTKMNNQGFSNDEIAQVNKLFLIGEEIKKIEQIAFAATQGLYDKNINEFTDDGEPDLEYAKDLIYSKKYVSLLNNLYKNTDILIMMTEARTQNIVNKAENNLKNLIYWVIVFVVTNTLIILGLYLAVKKYLLKPIFALTKGTKEISKQNYTYEISHKDWLYELNLLAETFNDMSKDISEDVKIREQNRIEIEKAKILIEEAHKKTRDSIEYASLIQRALIPDDKLFKDFFKDHFIIWDPKDVVGGDIYFYQQLRNENESLLMVIDCTGHGVPGAFVTLLVKAIERNIVSYILNSSEDVSPSKILSIFNKSIKHLMKQDHSESVSSAGFDGQILYFNKDKNIIKFSSAKNELLYSYSDEIEMIKGDRHSIGYKDSDINYEFKEHTLEIKDNLTLYLSSDGYWDQLGGEKERSFGKKRFKTLVNEIKEKNMLEQKEILTKSLDEYQGFNPRQDDITVVALKF